MFLKKDGFALTIILVAIGIWCVQLWADTDATPLQTQPVPKRSELQTQATQSELRAWYDAVACLSERSEAQCSFPLLTDYHRRCGRFPGLTDWTNASAGFPKARLIAQLCHLPDVTSAPSSLRKYVAQNNISSIAIFGDSQGARSARAFFSLVEAAGFRCKVLKKEPSGNKIRLQYYTDGSMFTPNDAIHRTCISCNSELRFCSNSGGRKLSVEYLSMVMSATTPLGGHCNDTSHPICEKATQQEYVLKHYLRRPGNTYPQLLLFFSTFGHDTNKPLSECYDGVRYLYDLMTRYIPAASTVIWYVAPAWHATKFKDSKWFTSEGFGYNPNDKLQAQNEFLAQLQLEHQMSNKSPPMFSFFNLYHMDEQLRGKWASDHIHYNPSWYAYVIRYTATLLPSLPIL